LRRYPFDPALKLSAGVAPPLATSRSAAQIQISHYVIIWSSCFWRIFATGMDGERLRNALQRLTVYFLMVHCHVWEVQGAHDCAALRLAGKVRTAGDSIPAMAGWRVNGLNAFA
jgi:hypothetical protein